MANTPPDLPFCGVNPANPSPANPPPPPRYRPEQVARTALEDGPFKVEDLIGGRYRVVAPLGRGDHAFVYDCFDAFLAQNVAVKVIQVSGRELARRARTEAKVLFRLNHPNVVRVTTASKLGDGMIYLVMERLRGRSLREILQCLGSLSMHEALNIAVQVADGVAAAHELEVIHRDLRPENVFVQAQNRVKVLDFGIAKLLGERQHTTRKKLTLGALLYTSPEQLEGQEATFRSDVYAVGTMLYEMLSGTHPCLCGVGAASLETLAWLQVKGLLPPLEQPICRLPGPVGLLLRRAMAKSPAERYASMQEFAAAVRAALGHGSDEADHGSWRLRDLWLAGGGRPRTTASSEEASMHDFASSQAGLATSHRVLVGDRAPEPYRSAGWRRLGAKERPLRPMLLAAVSVGMLAAVPIGMAVEDPEGKLSRLGVTATEPGWLPRFLCSKPAHTPEPTPSSGSASSPSALRLPPRPTPTSVSTAMALSSVAAVVPEPAGCSASSRVHTPPDAPSSSSPVAARVDPSGKSSFPLVARVKPLANASPVAPRVRASASSPPRRARKDAPARRTRAELVLERTRLFETETGQDQPSRPKPALDCACE
jgi:serine/threonine protein kinase